MKDDKLSKIIGVQPPPEERVPHNFQEVKHLTQRKGKMFKSKSGLYQIANEDKYTYRCWRCDSEIEVPGKIELEGLNMQMTAKFSCKSKA